MKNHDFPFVKKRFIWYAISAVFIIAGLISMAVQGFNLGIDFTGGNLFQIAFTDTTNVEDLREVVNKYVDVTPNIQQSENNEFMVRTVSMEEAESTALLADITSTLGENKVLRNEHIGPVVGKELVSNAKWAMIISLILMLIYITIRFKFFYAVSALVPLIHDVLITLGFISILQVEIDSAFVAAILTILGYSINATIVIFDRIRENVGYGVKGGFSHVVNLSVNQTLGRSVNTVVAVLILILALFIFGGVTTKSFMLTLLIGTIGGGYSSVFIAGPMLSDMVNGLGKGDVSGSLRKSTKKSGKK